MPDHCVYQVAVNKVLVSFQHGQLNPPYSVINFTESKTALSIQRSLLPGDFLRRQYVSIPLIMLVTCHHRRSSLTTCCPSRAQYAVLTKELDIQEVFLVIGFSMGGQQVYFSG